MWRIPRPRLSPQASASPVNQGAQHLNPGGILVVELGHNRAAAEAAFPHLAFTWPETSGGDQFVFVLTREQLL